MFEDLRSNSLVFIFLSSTTCLAIKWRLFIDLPCYKMALVSRFALLQNGACFTTCLATKWRLFHDLPCCKMALVSRFALPQNGAGFMTYLAAKWRWFHDLPCRKMELIHFPPSRLPNANLSSITCLFYAPR